MLKLEKLKSLLSITGVASLLLLPMLVFTTAQAAPDPKGSACQGSKLEFSTAPADCTATTSGAQSGINKLIERVVNVFSMLVGIVAVIMIIFGGFKYVTAGGDSGSISSAKTTILFAIVGLVIVAMAQIIVKFVLAKATGVVST